MSEALAVKKRTGSNSPFAEALVARLEEPGLEIGFLFRRVRDDVMMKTNARLAAGPGRSSC
jgi:uncharacterized caspase-like protein